MKFMTAIRTLKYRVIGRPTVYLGQDMAITKTIFGHKMFLDTRDVSLTPHLITDGFWEEGPTCLMKKLVKPGMNVIDVGANNGYFTLLLASIVGEKGRVTSFEANPLLAKILFRNVHINGYINRVNVNNKAVFSSTKKMKFNICKEYHGSSSFWINNDSLIKYHDSTNTIEVDSVSLDEFLGTNEKVDFLRIDAEGSDPHIIDGARQLISKNKNIIIIMEYIPEYLKLYYPDIKTFFENIRIDGFNISKINNNGSYFDVSSDTILNGGHCDLILTRKSSNES